MIHLHLCLARVMALYGRCVCARSDHSRLSGTPWPGLHSLVTTARQAGPLENGLTGRNWLLQNPHGRAGVRLYGTGSVHSMWVEADGVTIYCNFLMVHANEENMG